MSKGTVNKAIIIGRLGADPELRTTASAINVANFSVATVEKSKSGEQTEWHRMVAFGKLAEIVAQYLHKGSKAYFEGRIQTKKWQDQQGQTRYSTEIIASEMQMLDGKSDSPAVAPQVDHAPVHESTNTDGFPPF